MQAWFARELMRQDFVRVHYVISGRSRQGFFVRADLTKRQHKKDDCVTRRALSVNEVLGHDFRWDALRLSGTI